MLNDRRKAVGVLLASLLIVGCFARFDQVDRARRDYDESMHKAETDFVMFLDMSERIIGGETISFDDYTEHYMQLRVRLSDWNHLRRELSKKNGRLQISEEDESFIGEFSIDVERFYFCVVHMCYIKDERMDNRLLMKTTDSLMTHWEQIRKAG